MDLQGCTALITGASSGIGREFARQLTGRAGAIILVARRRERLEELREELISRALELSVHIHVADLTKAGAVDGLCRVLEDQHVAVDLLINNAGLGDHGLFATGDSERTAEMMQLNIVTLTMLTRRLLPEMIARERGGILNVSSCASFLPLPRMAVYAATKAYVTSFSEALRMEVHGSGIHVSALCPGPVHTEFNALAKRANEPSREAPDFTYVSTEEVVRVALEGIENERPIVIPGRAMKLAMLLVRLTPMPLLRLALRAGA